MFQEKCRDMKVYISLISIGAILMLYFGYILRYPIETLFVYIFVYKPLIDYVYIKKRNLYKGRNLLLKYPFWGYGSKLLFSK